MAAGEEGWQPRDFCLYSGQFRWRVRLGDAPAGTMHALFFRAPFSVRCSERCGRTCAASARICSWRQNSPTGSYRRADWPSKSFRRTATEIVSLREREITARRGEDVLQPLPRRPGCQASEETEREGGLRTRGDATAFAPPMIPGGRQPRRTAGAMNPKSGCSYWTFQANGPMQSAPRVSNARVWRCRPGGSPCLVR